MSKTTKTVITALFLLAAGGAQAATIDTVDWAADSSVDGTGTGTLQNGTITVTYNTVVAGNAGIWFSDNWNTSPATDGVGTANHLTGGAFGTTPGSSPATQTIAFSAAVTDPILYINWGDATSSMNFGSYSLSLLDSNHAQLTGNVATFTGATNTVNDGFAARINGTFGPGTPIQFTYSTSVAFDSTTFTIGLTPQTVPEPSSLFLLAAGSLPLLTRRLRRS